MNLKMIGLIIGYILAIIFLFELYEHQLGAIFFFYPDCCLFLRQPIVRNRKKKKRNDL
ncbi:hypothetical protein RCO48_12445 [Peribacillus frigoritolerans]|nr:hypothetical protein [Peribacillus frigoritolerans]